MVVWITSLDEDFTMYLALIDRTLPNRVEAFNLMTCYFLFVQFANLRDQGIP